MGGTEGTACQLCPAPLTTRLLGSEDAADCICPKGTYMPAIANFMQRCRPCPEGLDCALGSAEAHIPAARGAAPGGVFPTALPSYFVTEQEPLSVYLCLDDVSCPGGTVNACGAGTRGIACGTCPPGQYRAVNKGCLECTGFAHSREIVAVLVLVVGPLVCYVLHALSKKPLHLWGSPSSAMVDIIFVTLLYSQSIAVVWMCYLSYPVELSRAVEWTTLVLELMAPVWPECTDFSAFELGFVLKLLTPVYALAIFAATWLFSRVVEKTARRLGASERIIDLCHLDGAIVMGCYGGLYNTFFIGIASRLFDLFQCYEHPNGESSLRSAPSVLCDSDTWGALLWPAIFAIAVFCVGVLTLFGYVSLKAPGLFHDEAFRKKTQFLYVKFRPSIWWWGMVLLLKGVWLNLSTVFFTDGHLQLAWLSVAHLVYLTIAFAYMPWRSLGVATLDIAMNAFLLLFLSFLPYFAFQSEVTRQDATFLTIFFSFSPLAGSVVVVFAQLRLRFHPPTALDWQIQAERMCKVFRRLTDPDEARLVMEMLPTADIWTLHSAEQMLQAEMLWDSVPSQRATRLAMCHSRNESGSKISRPSSTSFANSPRSSSGPASSIPSIGVILVGQDRSQEGDKKPKYRIIQV